MKLKDKEKRISIDIGSKNIKALFSEYDPQKDELSIRKELSLTSHGLRYGYIQDEELVLQSLFKLMEKAEKIGEKIEEATFSIGGIGLNSKMIKVGISFSEKQEIEERDLNRVLEKAERLFAKKYPNQKILHIIPNQFEIDKREILGSPLTMFGLELGVKVLFITIPEHHYESLYRVIDRSGIIINDIIAGPLAESLAVADYTQKMQGCAVLNIGSETSSLVTFENGIISSCSVEKMGSNDITNDLALGLQISLREAEAVKLGKNKNYPQKKVHEIIAARNGEIITFIKKQLKSLKKYKLLPAGIILTGGGSRLPFMEESVKKIALLPAELVSIEKWNPKTKRKTDIGAEYSVAYGLSFERGDLRTKKHRKKFSFKKIKKKILLLLEQLKP